MKCTSCLMLWRHFQWNRKLGRDIPPLLKIANRYPKLKFWMLPSSKCKFWNVNVQELTRLKIPLKLTYSYQNLHFDFMCTLKVLDPGGWDNSTDLICYRCSSQCLPSASIPRVSCIDSVVLLEEAKAQIQRFSFFAMLKCCSVCLCRNKSFKSIK